MLDIPRRRITDHLGIQQPQLREDDGTHNTSISSLSGGEVGAHYYQQQQHHQLASTYPPPILEWKSPEDTKDETNDSAATDQFAFAEPVHSKLFLDDDMYGYSDDDDSDHAPAIGGSVGRTRLDFNLVLGGDDPDDMRDGKSSLCAIVLISVRQFQAHTAFQISTQGHPKHHCLVASIRLIFPVRLSRNV